MVCNGTIFCEIATYFLKSGYPKCGFPSGSNDKEYVCNAEDSGWIPSWEDPMEKGMATHFIFLPGEFYGQRSLVDDGPGGHKELDTTEQLTLQQQMYGCVCAKSLQSSPTLCNTMDHSSPGFSDYGILQARILECVAMPPLGGLPKPRTDSVSLPTPELTGCFFTISATWEVCLSLTGSLFCLSSLVYLYFSLNRNSL